MSVQIGELAPEFCLPDAEGNLIQLSDFRGRRVILYFYPRDNTPGCTKEACAFRDSYQEYQARDIVILGISCDSADSHRKFARKHQLPFPLLCDVEAKVATAYGSYGPKKFMGRDLVGVYRSTFAIAPDGTVEKIYRKIKPEAHPGEILVDLFAV